MQIAEKHVVTLNYTLTDAEGEMIDQSRDGSFVYLHGAGNIISGLETALTGKSVGDSFKVTIAPEDGYGPRYDERVEEVPRTMFPEGTPVEPGMQFHAQGPQGQHITVEVLEVTEETVKVDGNHPLAGVELHFDVEVMGIREADEAELSHGHVHGEHGHHH